MGRELPRPGATTVGGVQDYTIRMPIGIRRKGFAHQPTSLRGYKGKIVATEGNTGYGGTLHPGAPTITGRGEIRLAHATTRRAPTKEEGRLCVHQIQDR